VSRTGDSVGDRSFAQFVAVSAGPTDVESWKQREAKAAPVVRGFTLRGMTLPARYLEREANWAPTFALNITTWWQS